MVCSVIKWYGPLLQLREARCSKLVSLLFLSSRCRHTNKSRLFTMKSAALWFTALRKRGRREEGGEEEMGGNASGGRVTK